MADYKQNIDKTDGDTDDELIQKLVNYVSDLLTTKNISKDDISNKLVKRGMDEDIAIKFVNKVEKGEDKDSFEDSFFANVVDALTDVVGIIFEE